MHSSKKLYFSISMLIALALTIFLPGKAIERGSSTMISYEYGYPFNYITIHQFQPESRWFITNLLSDDKSFSMDPFTFLINAAAIYFIIDFIKSFKTVSLDEKKKAFKYLGMLFLGLLLIYKLPHNSYTIMQYIIRPISFNSGGVLHLAGLPIVILFIYAITKILDLQMFFNKSKFIAFLILVFVVMPLMSNTISFTRTAYHIVVQSGLSAIDCNFNNSRVNLSTGDDRLASINVNLELMDYGGKSNEFKVRIHIPDQWKAFFDIDYVELENTYTTYGYRNTINIQEAIQLEIAEDYTAEDLFASRWYYETFYYELYNDKESIIMVDHGR